MEGKDDVTNDLENNIEEAVNTAVSFLMDMKEYELENMEANPHIKVDLEKYKDVNPNDEEYKLQIRKKESFLDKETYAKVTDFNTKYGKEDITGEEEDRDDVAEFFKIENMESEN